MAMSSKFLEWMYGPQCLQGVIVIYFIICVYIHVQKYEYVNTYLDSNVSPLHTTYKRVKLGVWNNKKNIHKET